MLTDDQRQALRNDALKQVAEEERERAKNVPPSCTCGGAGEWRDIASAPKDGTEFAGGWARANRYATGTPMCWQINDKREGWFMLSPTYEDDYGKFFHGHWINERDYPTHWRPRLLPPKEKP